MHKREAFKTVLTTFAFFMDTWTLQLYSYIRLFQWLPDKEGLVNGCVVAGFGGGAFIFDQIQTAYINPHNEKANFDENGEK